MNGRFEIGLDAQLTSRQSVNKRIHGEKVGDLFSPPRNQATIAINIGKCRNFSHLIPVVTIICDSFTTEIENRYAEVDVSQL